LRVNVFREPARWVHVGRPGQVRVPQFSIGVMTARRPFKVRGRMREDSFDGKSRSRIGIQRSEVPHGDAHENRDWIRHRRPVPECENTSRALFGREPAFQQVHVIGIRVPVSVGAALGFASSGPSQLLDIDSAKLFHGSTDGHSSAGCAPCKIFIQALLYPMRVICVVAISACPT